MPYKTAIELERDDFAGFHAVIIDADDDTVAHITNSFSRPEDAQRDAEDWLHRKETIMSPTNDLAAELRATADALRQLRAALYKQVHEGQDIRIFWPEIATIVVQGFDTTRALESLAAKLDEAK